MTADPPPHSACLVIPTRNGMPAIADTLRAVQDQGDEPRVRIVIDSDSEDATREVARELGFHVEKIPLESFDHGGTRRYAVEAFASECDVVIFLTQDAEPATPDAFEKLLSRFEDPAVAAAYGRQLPRPDATPIEAHARLFNYPAENHEHTADDIASRGIRAAFFSNSWAAYRTSDLATVGGIPRQAVCSEDVYVAAKLLLAGKKIAYAGDAAVYHSHKLSLLGEFRRYFDIGAYHRIENWLLETLGEPHGEGGRFVRSELSYLLRVAPWRIPEALLRTLLKLAGYKLGRVHRHLPRALVRWISANRGCWDRSFATEAQRTQR
ncbi:MAG: glycosyltransferase [Pseudomonadota bacterium]